MKYSSRQQCMIHLPRQLFFCLALLLLSGCAREPDSVALETAEATNKAKPAVGVDGIVGDNADASANDANERRQAAAEVEVAKVKIDAGEFLDNALNGKIDAVRQAIEAGVDVNLTDEQQRTALLFASFNGHTSVVKLLLDNGAQLSQRDAMGRTALMFASTGDNTETVELLLEKGSDVNAVDAGEGFTALMHAAAEGHVDVVKVLLKYNADPDMRDVDGDSARDFATQNRHVAVAQLLGN